MELDRPAPAGDLFVNKENVGKLLVIEVLEPLRAFPTQNGPADCIRCNIWTVEPPGRVAERYTHTILYGQLLFSRLTQSVGRKVVGILTGQPGVVQNGRSVAYDLEDPPDAAFTAAGQAMAAEVMARPQPSNGQQPATAGPWGQPAGAPPGSWGPPPNQQPVPQQGPPPGWGQQPQSAPWGQQPAAPAADPWGQQQIPAQNDAPPWERQPAAAPPWGGQQ